MTFSTARITRLEIVRLSGEEWYVFRWTAEGDEWQDVLTALKERVEPIMRRWEPDTKKWWVNSSYDEELADIFSNFRALDKEVRSQLEMAL